MADQSEQGCNGGLKGGQGITPVAPVIVKQADGPRQVLTSHSSVTDTIAAGSGPEP